MKVGAIMLAGALLAAGCAFNADLPRPEPAPGCAMLPQDHQYERVLRQYMATLTERDFVHGVAGGLTRTPPDPDPEYQYRNYLFTMMQQPMVGTKRGAPSVNAPAKLFVLSAIETPEGVMSPPVWPESLMGFEGWDYPGNPYHNNRALKLRAFVTASVRLMMLDDYLDKTPTTRRSDRVGYHLVYAGAPYPGFRDMLPRSVCRAYEAGLEKLGRRIIEWGPKGEEPNLDMTAPVGLWYASKALNNPEFTREVEAYGRKLLTDPRYFHPAGYYIERGGLDMGFSGMTNFFSVWLALATDWTFAKDAVDRVYRLRAHLCLPEPDGKFTGPTHFNTRLGSPACADQWDWNFRDYAAAMVTDEAAYLVKLPSADRLQAAAAARAGMFNHHLEETQGIRFKGATAADFAKLGSGPWSYHLWNTYNFPASVNFGYEFYKKGSYAHLLKLEQENSPFLKSPFLREETFVRNFGDAFIVAKQPTYSVILHTGPVGHQDPNDGLFQFTGPLGLSGGQLSAFWTPSTCSVILGRRAGMNWDNSVDKVEQWRLWPIHAVSGCAPDGKAFTSARIVKPAVVAIIEGDGGTVEVSGVLPGEQLEQGKVLDGRIEYSRTFRIEPGRVHVRTTIKGDGRDTASELYETLPVFLRDSASPSKAVPTAIEFQVGGQWAPATADYQEKVTAIKLTRFGGAAQITFSRPVRVKLSPAEWKDTYLSGAVCRNVMIDLLEGGPLTGERTLNYDIVPAVK